MDRVDYEKMIIQDVINLHNNKELDINPWYQRRNVWTQAQKSYLINTLFEHKPIPSIYIRHSLDLQAEKSIRQVVDGQQRVRSILEYVNNDFSAKHPNYPKRVKYSQLKRPDIESFRLTGISVGYLLGATDEDVIEIFGRLNSVAKTLNAQEKRNARFSGEFKQFCLTQAATRLPIWRGLNIFSSNDIARMVEVQFISDLALTLLMGLSDYSSRKLDTIYAKFDNNFPKQSNVERRFEKLFSQIASLKPESIRDTIFRRSPLFFSLCVVLDASKTKLPSSKIESALYAIDENLNSGIPLSARKKEDAEFYTACTASTQRIKQRKIRNSFIKKHLGL
jgi:hypothetical protein